MKGECQRCGEEYFVQDPKDRFCGERCAKQWVLLNIDAAYEDEHIKRLEEPRPFPSRDDYIDNYEDE